MRRGSFTELNAFVAVADTKSFRAAAKALDVTPSALSHSLKALESRLGVRLLNRTTRSVALTEAGERLVAKVRPSIAALEEAMTETSSMSAKPSGSIRISAAESGARILIQQVLPQFAKEYPDIHIEFVVDTRLVDIVRDGFDAGIRVFDDVPKDMIAVRFGPDMRFAAVASPEYVAKHGAPKSAADLMYHRCIRFRFESGALYKWELRRNTRESALDVQGPVTLGNVNLMIEAARAGIGIAWVPMYQASPFIESGALIDLLPKYCPTFPGLCLYYPANRHAPTALRLFADAVRASKNEKP
jgi:DNA-binding transcriptional LysR family regulator